MNYEEHKQNIEATYDQIMLKLQEPGTSEVTTVTISKQTKEILDLLESLSGKPNDTVILDAIFNQMIMHYLTTGNQIKSKEIAQLIQTWKDKNGKK